MTHTILDHNAPQSVSTSGATLPVPETPSLTASKKLLDHVLPNERSTLHGIFLRPVQKEGVTDPSAIIYRVKADLERRAKYAPRAGDFAAIVASHPDEAYELALDALIPKAVRDKGKYKKGRPFLSGRSTSDKQRGYLRDLGCSRKIPDDMGEASDLITRLKKGRA